MKVLGVTGSMGMGKSLVCRMLCYQGFPVKDADRVVHDLFRNHQGVIRTIGERFPEVVRQGYVDREVLARCVTSDGEVLGWLGTLLHPLVKRAFETFIAYQKRRGCWLVVLEVPLLFETSMERYCDAVVVVSASWCIQRARLLARPHMTPERLGVLLKAQLDDRIKRRRADFVLFTGCSKAETWYRIRRIVRCLKFSVRRGVSRVRPCTTYLESL